ncbi:MAG: helix-turn-helix transcriptional regulator [Christensenellales bacterium]|jgi:predicted DNA-binding transcriptional regulator YafY
MQIHRLFEIVHLLLAQESTTARELAERFEVSVRTIYRDIETLSASGIPVYTQQGTGGGIFIDKDFVLDKSLLSDAEQNQILVALKSVSAAPYLDHDALLERLGGLFHKSHTDWIEVDFTRWGNISADKDKFDALCAAVIGSRAVTFDYISGYSSGVFQSRSVRPVKLVYKSKAWYLLAHDKDKNDYRLFKISRMVNVCQAPDTFDKSALPPAPPVDFYDHLAAKIPTVHIVLRFSRRVAHRVYDEFNHTDIHKQPDGSFIVELDMPEDGWLYGFVLSFAGEVEVLEPPIVRQRLVLLTTMIQKKYMEPS